MKINARTLYIAGALVALLILGLDLFIYWPNFLSVDSDLTYHLATAQSFVKNGGLGLIENWDSLPLGRPHLYPPVLHFLMAILVALKLAPFTIILIASCGGTIAMLLLSWYALLKLFGEKTAFWFMLLGLSYLPFIKVLGITLPASVVIVLSPFLLPLLKKSKVAAATILLVFLLYTHMVFPWFVIAALIVWGICNRKHFTAVRNTVVMAVLIYLPWLLYIVSNVEYLRYFGPNYQKIIELTAVRSIDVTLFALFIIALGVMVKKWRTNLVNKDISFFIALAIVSLPMAYFEFSRYSYSIGFFGIVVTTAYFVAELKTMWPWARDLVFSVSITKKTYIRVPVAILVFIILIFVSYNVTQTRGSVFTSIRYNTVLETLPWSPKLEVFNYYTNHFNSTNFAVAQTIERETPPNAIILNLGDHLDKEDYQPHRTYNITQLFAALSNRNMADLRSPESNWQQRLPVRQADILMVNSTQISATGTIAHSHGVNINDGFVKIAQARGGMLFYKNLDKEPVTLPDARVVLPLWLGWLLLAAGSYYIAKIYRTCV